MTLMFIDPGMITPIVQYSLAQEPSNIRDTWNGDVSNLTDHAAASPTFDTQDAVFTSLPINAASQNAIGNNSNGVVPLLSVSPTLSYQYTSGYTNMRSTSQAVTIGVTQSFNYQFSPTVGGATTLSASGTFSWTSGTSDTHTSTIANAVAAPFQVPAGKIYEEKLLFSQQQVEVPYTIPIFVDGRVPLTEITGVVTPIPIGLFFQNVAAAGGVGVAPYKDVNWTDISYVENAEHLATEGVYLLHGTLTMEAASTFTVQLFDITNGAAQASLVSQYGLSSSLTSPPPGGQPVPEPSSLAALATGLLGLGLAAGRKRTAACWSRCRDVLASRDKVTQQS